MFASMRLLQSSGRRITQLVPDLPESESRADVGLICMTQKCVGPHPVMIYRLFIRDKLLQVVCRTLSYFVLYPAVRP